MKQIQSCCDTAKFAAAYLSQQTPPKHEDNETTIADLRARIAKVVGYLSGFQAACQIYLVGTSQVMDFAQMPIIHH